MTKVWCNVTYFSIQFVTEEANTDSFQCADDVRLSVANNDASLAFGRGRRCSVMLEVRVDTRVCCAACSRLRRPYQGNIQCSGSRDRGDVTTTCKVSCLDGFVFSGPVLSEYTCGPDTRYLWPHQSPDNPRALLPACTGNQLTSVDQVLTGEGDWARCYFNSTLLLSTSWCWRSDLAVKIQLIMNTFAQRQTQSKNYKYTGKTTNIKLAKNIQAQKKWSYAKTLSTLFSLADQSLFSSLLTNSRKRL